MIDKGLLHMLNAAMASGHEYRQALDETAGTCKRLLESAIGKDELDQRLRFIDCMVELKALIPDVRKRFGDEEADDLQSRLAPIIAQLKQWAGLR